MEFSFSKNTKLLAWHNTHLPVRLFQITLLITISLLFLTLTACSKVKKREGAFCEPKGLPSTLVRTVLTKNTVECVYEDDETDVKKCMLTPKPLIAREWIVSGSRDNPIRICIKKCKGLVLEHVSCEYKNC
jgi:hypothetical protein